MPLLDIRELQIDFDAVRAVDGVSLTIEEGETVCLVGESGCGKSVTALSIARLLATPPARYSGGEIRVQGRDVLRMTRDELRHLRGGVVAYVFQEAGAALNPVIRIGAQIRESLKLHQPSKASAEDVVQWLRRVGIPAPEDRWRDYPHELSGGMQQRVMIAMALASRPKLLVADEPTTALDVTLQAQVLELLGDLKRQLGMSLLLISHNLALVSGIADRVCVMYAGQIVEAGPVQTVMHHPRHPYTQALLQSLPMLGREVERLAAIPGNVPRLGAWPAGCRFHPRCSRAREVCRHEPPQLTAVPGSQPGELVRCPFWNEGMAIPASSRIDRGL